MEITDDQIIWTKCAYCGLDFWRYEGDPAYTICIDCAEYEIPDFDDED